MLKNLNETPFLTRQLETNFEKKKTRCACFLDAANIFISDFLSELFWKCSQSKLAELNKEFGCLAIETTGFWTACEPKRFFLSGCSVCKGCANRIHPPGPDKLIRCWRVLPPPKKNHFVCRLETSANSSCRCHGTFAWRKWKWNAMRKNSCNWTPGKEPAIDKMKWVFQIFKLFILTRKRDPWRQKNNFTLNLIYSANADVCHFFIIPNCFKLILSFLHSCKFYIVTLLAESKKRQQDPDKQHAFLFADHAD